MASKVDLISDDHFSGGIRRFGQDRHAGAARCEIGIWYDHEALENLLVDSSRSTAQLFLETVSFFGRMLCLKVVEMIAYQILLCR
jgi:hypothetical protein